VVLVLAIDIGGTNTRLGLVDTETGLIVERTSLPTPPREAAGTAFLDAVAEAAVGLASDAPVVAVGLCICELVSVDGRIESGHRVPWQRLPVVAALGAIAPIRIEADVRAAALAEARFGAGRGFDPFLYLNIGTGISAVLVQDGRPYRGAHGHALVIASGPTTSSCPHCGGRHEVVLEDIAGGAGLATLFAKATGGTGIEPPEIRRRAAAGEAPALEAVMTATEALGSALGAILGLTDPATLIIGGGLGAAPGPYIEALLPEIRRHIWSPRTRAIPIIQAGLGGDAGLIGAALAAWPLGRGP
jgi:glucokinase